MRARWADVPALARRIPGETPPRGAHYYRLLTAQDEKKLEIPMGAETEDLPLPGSKLILTRNQRKVKIQFRDLPISKATVDGLQGAKFYRMTNIQRCCIPHALAGRNILGCSKTGSGKTLAFLIPLVQALYRQKWSPLDKLGAVVLLPTRELAMQVFDTLRKFADRHEMSAGLIIGGKSLKEERELLYRMNILVATPGRLLQHLESTQYFDADNLKLLVFDEVDRMFDMGFQDEVSQILDYFPLKQLQLMFFSATVSPQIQKLVGSLAGSFESFLLSEARTPVKLLQHYMIVPLEQKLDVLFSFIRSHTKAKALVFFSSCKQVRFAYEALSRLKPGVKLFELHGRMRQKTRTEIFFEFKERHKAAFLFATDIAQRGIDFPAVDWVIQVDCPEDVETYVHRVGRTARYKSRGNGLLFLTPKELGFIKKLEASDIPVKKVAPGKESQLTIKDSLGKLCARHKELKGLAEKSFRTYIKSIFLLKDKSIFKELDFKGYAESLGLASVPEVKVMEEIEDIHGKTKVQKLREKIKLKKEAKKLLAEKQSHRIAKSDQDSEDQEDSEDQDFLVPKRKAEPLGEAKKQEEQQLLEKGRGGKVSAEAHFAELAGAIAGRQKEDRAKERERVQAKHLKRKLARKQQD